MQFSLLCGLYINPLLDLVGFGCGLSGDWAHPGEQGPKDAQAYLPCARTHQPLHELPMPHRNDPHWEGADRSQTRRGGFSEEKGMIDVFLNIKKSKLQLAAVMTTWALNVWRTGYHSNCCWWTLLNQFLFFFTDFSKETEKAETYVSGVNVNKVQHPYYQMTLFLLFVILFIDLDIMAWRWLK